MKKLYTLVLVLHFSALVLSQSPGLLRAEPSAARGYLLFAPLQSRSTYLIDKCGKLVREWKSRYRPGQAAYLLPDGSLLRCANDSNTAFASAGGRIEKFSWDGKLLWSYALSSSTTCLHHDICPMPNGNVLAIVWEKKTAAELKAAGRNPNLMSNGIWSEKLIEIKPAGTDKGIIVWEWKAWDHLVQDQGAEMANYGTVSKSPRLLNINYRATREEDWLHFNSVSYNPALDQVMISNRNFSEIYILDHGTSTAEAAKHAGGRQGMGGDILYRWGNPAAYNCGTDTERRLFMQHSAGWIGKGLQDEGKIMIFNNGTEKQGEIFSSVDIIEPPVSATGAYTRTGATFMPEDPSWAYPGMMPEKFYSKNVSNAQRLPNGNTLVCEGANGRFFEINPDKMVVWAYMNPVNAIEAGVPEQNAQSLNQVFRCLFYSPDYSGFKGRDLSPGKPLESEPSIVPCPIDVVPH